MKTRAFTLVELLIALTITVILVVLLASAVSAALGMWRQGRNRIDTFQVARQVLLRIGDELKGARAIPGRLQFLENSPQLGAGAAYATTNHEKENCFFVGPYPNLQNGDLCVFAYRLNVETLELERAFFPSADAWAPASGSRYQIGGYTYTNPSTSAPLWHPIAQGIVDFEVRAFDVDGHTIISPWDSQTQGRAPKRVVIRLRAVDDTTAGRLQVLTAGTPAHTQTLLEAAREFSTEIWLP